MGTHASAEAFYGASWPIEEEPERWSELGIQDREDGTWEALEEILEELGLGDLLKVTSHGNQAYDYTGYAVYVRGTHEYFYLGSPKLAPAAPEVSSEAEAALARAVDHLGRENVVLGWQVTVSYG